MRKEGVLNPSRTLPKGSGTPIPFSSTIAIYSHIVAGVAGVDVWISPKETMERKNKPPKRKESIQHNNVGKPATKYLKGRKKEHIPLKTTIQIIEEFKDEAYTLYPDAMEKCTPFAIKFCPLDGCPLTGTN